MSLVETCPSAIRGISGVAVPEAPSDQDLVERMANADQSALRELMRRNRGRLQRFVTRLLNDRDQIDDVVNDTFMAAWRQAAMNVSFTTSSIWSRSYSIRPTKRCSRARLRRISSRRALWSALAMRSTRS